MRGPKQGPAPKRTQGPITVVVGVICLAVGMGGGVWFAQEVLPPARAPGAPLVAVRDAAKPTAAVAPKQSTRAPTAVAPEQSTRAPTEDAPVVETQPVPAATQVATTAAVPAPPAPVVVASAPTAPPRPVVPVLYTCPDARHLDATADKPGKCGRCGQRLVAVATVKHGLEAMAHFATEPAPPAVVVATRPAPTAARLYTCARSAHLDATSDQPGPCKHCGQKLVPATTVPHGMAAIARFSGVKTTATRPALFTCMAVDHVDATTDKPGTCARCKLTLLPVERVGHEHRAVKAWQRKRSRTPERKPTTMPALYTCRDIAHVDATTLQPGNCPNCRQALWPLDRVFNQVEAVEAFLKKYDRPR